jgi:hypothetical protein
MATKMELKGRDAGMRRGFFFGPVQCAEAAETYIFCSR